MNLQLTKWHILGIIGVPIIGLLGFAGLEFSSSDTFCGVCHYHKSFTEPWHASAHFAEGVTCSNCHIGHDPRDIAGAVAEFLRKQGRYEEAKFFEERIEEERKV